MRMAGENDSIDRTRRNSADYRKWIGPPRCDFCDGLQHPGLVSGARAATRQDQGRCGAPGIAHRVSLAINAIYPGRNGISDKVYFKGQFAAAARTFAILVREKGYVSR
jgi:hypothetical protein